MLAYFFCHWKRDEVDTTEYDQSLNEFHQILNESACPGFARSWSVALKGVDWANKGHDSYEDWYLVNNSAALDALNDAAISAARKSPHDRAASRAGGGHGGLYRLRAGEVVGAPAFTAWFSKPDGWGYAQLFERLTPSLSIGGALWQRQMALGPGEFCLHTVEPIKIPDGINANWAETRPVFPRGA